MPFAVVTTHTLRVYAIGVPQPDHAGIEEGDRSSRVVSLQMRSCRGMLEAAWQAISGATDWAALAAGRTAMSDAAFAEALQDTLLARAAWHCYGQGALHLSRCGFASGSPALLLHATTSALQNVDLQAVLRATHMPCTCPM